MRSGGSSKISASEERPISMSSASVREGTRSALGPANQPVSTGWLAGCCVHHVGTAASDTRNDRSAKSPRPSSTQNFVAKRSRILTTLPNPISAAAAARLRATGGNAISDKSGKGTVRIARSEERRVEKE